MWAVVEEEQHVEQQFLKMAKEVEKEKMEEVQEQSVIKKLDMKIIKIKQNIPEEEQHVEPQFPKTAKEQLVEEEKEKEEVED